MTKGKTIQAQLARTLDKANMKEKKKPRPAPAIQADRKCEKVSISLYQTDLDRLQAIRVFMANRGEIVSTSQAFRLALRTAPLSDELMEALDQARREDGRKW
jgi:mRNA-degrading endonuclease toxin of MazEF toxin-antitoxin module